MRSCTGISTSVRSSPPRALYFCVLPCGASLTGLCAVRAYKDFVLRCTVRAPRAFCAVRAYKGFIQRAPGLVLLCTLRALAWCEPTKALRFCVPYERQELCAVRASEGFVPLCAVRASRALCGASLQRLSTVRTSARSFARCEPTKALCLCVPYERQELCAVRASEGFVPLCAVRASRAFVRCEPTKPFYRVLVPAPQDLLCARVQEPVHMYCLYELTRYLLFCTGTCMPVCRGTEHSRGLVRLRVFFKHPQSRTI